MVNKILKEKKKLSENLKCLNEVRLLVIDETASKIQKLAKEATEEDAKKVLESKEIEEPDKLLFATAYLTTHDKISVDLFATCIDFASDLL